MIQNKFIKLKSRKKLILFASLLIVSRLVYFKRTRIMLLMKLLLTKFKLWLSITWTVFKYIHPAFPLTPARPLIL